MSQLKPGDLLDRCTNEKGRYLVFNAVNRDRYSIAAMRIFSGSRFGSDVPLFKTKKLFPNAKDGEVNGLLFQTGESIYAVGRVKEEYRYRVTSMSYEYRGEEERTDLYGLRLSHNDKFKRPMAYRIYAYQIRGALRYRNVVKKLSGLRSFDDSVFDDLEISVGSDIKTKLFANHPLPNGLTVYIPDDEDEG